MMSQNVVHLDITPTIFVQYNKKANLPTDHLTSALTVQRLKHGHLRSMQRMDEGEQIHFLMSALTGLDQADLDELDIEDSAKLSEIIFGFMKRYAQIAKEMSRA